MQPIIVVILVLIVAWFLYRSTKKTTIVRYYRPSCPACIDSQKNWDVFAERVINNPKNYDFEVVNVNTEEQTEKTKKWMAHHKVNQVPTVIKVSKWLGLTEEYNGPRTKEGYLQFVRS